MNLAKKSIILCLGLLTFSSAYAQKKVTFTGSVQSDILLPQEDASIGTGTYDDWGLTNTYADFNLMSKYVDAGLRFEFTQFPLPGFENDFKGWGIPNFYVKGKFKGVELTLGDFYDQFGSGFIFRTYEERSLGIDNSLRGARVSVNAIKGVQLKMLGGVQRRYWDWSTNSIMGGADLEMNIDQYFQAMQDKNMTWMIGGSYVGRHEGDEEIIGKIDTSNPDDMKFYRLNLPLWVHAFDVRSRFQKGSYSVLAEYAMKSQDPSADNGYIYRKGNAAMLSASYSKRGLSALVQAKRSEDMSFRSQRSILGTSAFLNHLPAFSYQHTYALAALYPYATQMADGEWAFQGEFAYNIKRRTLLGGKYGTKLKLNVSHIRGLDKTPLETNNLKGTSGYTTSFFKTGDLYYQDINVQLEKKISKSFKLNLMYMNQRYNQQVVEGHGEIIKSNIYIAEGKYQFNKKFTLRGELQYLNTKQDEGDWAYGLLELSVLPYLMFTVSDMWNVGVTDQHYYLAGVTFNHTSHRLMVSYGRTRAGFNCAGGVCRYVPATKGLQISYNYNF